MSLRSDWNSAKSKMEKAGVEMKLFSKDFGSALDDYESADRKYQSVGGKDQKKLDEARKARKAAATKAVSIGKEYGTNIRYLEDRAKDAKQKAALEAAGDGLMPIVLKVQKGM
jgi:hypothetical protein